VTTSRRSSSDLRLGLVGDGSSRRLSIAHWMDFHLFYPKAGNTRRIVRKDLVFVGADRASLSSGQTSDLPAMADLFTKRVQEAKKSRDHRATTTIGPKLARTGLSRTTCRIGRITQLPQTFSPPPRSDLQLLDARRGRQINHNRLCKDWNTWQTSARSLALFFV